MAFRNLTDVYMLMRNNAIGNKNMFHDNQVLWASFLSNWQIANILLLIKFADRSTVTIGQRLFSTWRVAQRKRCRRFHLDGNRHDCETNAEKNNIREIVRI